MRTLTHYRRHIQALLAEAQADDTRLRAQAREREATGDEAGAIALLAGNIQPLERIGSLGNILVALRTIEGNITCLVAHGGFTDPLAPLLAEISRAVEATGAELRRLEALDEAAQNADTEAAWYEAWGRHEGLNQALGLLTGHLPIVPPRGA